MDKKISVIVPVYNVEQYLDRCIQSIVQQDYLNFEIILVNDGSTDTSAARCQKWALENDKIIVVDKENGGLSDARNAGIEKATGDFYLFIDSDDFIQQGMLSGMMKKLMEHEADICVCDMNYYYDNEEVKFSSGGEFESGNVHENPELIRINNSACNKLFAKEVFDGIRFPVGKVYEDLATIPKVLLKANTVIKVNQPYYMYYQRAGSIAHTTSDKVFDVYEAIDGCIQFAKENDASKAIIDELYHLYIIHGLDLTTLRIKDFDNSNVIEQYWKENMKFLRRYYPEYRSDSILNEMSWKKKLIFKLMDQGWMKVVKKIYGK